MLIGEDLDFDMARLDNELFDEDAVVTEAGGRFGARAFQLILEVVKRWWLQGFADMLVDQVSPPPGPEHQVWVLSIAPADQGQPAKSQKCARIHRHAPHCSAATSAAFSEVSISNVQADLSRNVMEKKLLM